MSHRIYRFLFVLLVAALPLQVFAQNNEVGLSLNLSKLSETTVVDEGESITLDFDETTGVALSYNHYWTPSFSTEFAGIGFGGDMKVGIEGSPSVEVGELDAAAVTAMGQWHFNRAGRFSPYVGAGLAFLGGEFKVNGDLEDGEPDSVDLETETSWVAGAGADVSLTRHVALNLDVRYMPWSAREEDGLIEDSLDVDPMIVSAGVKFRW